MFLKNIGKIILGNMVNYFGGATEHSHNVSFSGNKGTLNPNPFCEDLTRPTQAL